jgi:Host cell surface-exposed lipoprotein
MRKSITATLVAAAAIAALSGCKPNELGGSSNAAGGANYPVAVGHKAHAAAVPKQVAPRYSFAQDNAIRSAKSYLQMSGFSRAGLIQQLSSKAGEGFRRADAVFAVNHLKVNWNREAVESAKSYLQMSGFSRAGLIQQLSSKAGEGFTRAQAIYAVNHLGH